MSDEIDDSALFHASNYDPAKAREYYLRTRKLKGRRKGTSSAGPVSKSPAAARSNAVKRPAKTNQHAAARKRRRELKAKKEALEKRLERLTEALREAVKKAKGKNESQKKKQAPETRKDKADRNANKKGKKPETAAQKKERAKKAKEEYEKKNPGSLSDDIEVLREQIADVREKLAKAVAESNKKTPTPKTGVLNSGNKAKKVRTQGSSKPSGGPKGR